MNIGFDVLGGDFAPANCIEGAKLFLLATHDIKITLFANERTVAQYTDTLSAFQGRVHWVICSDQIEMNEHPTKALKSKPNNPISYGIDYLKNAKTDAFISAGNTGAMLVATMFAIPLKPNVLRPTIASPLPRVDGNGFNLLVDVGLNADCKPENLVQFAIIGSQYVKHHYGIETPTIGLLNIGEEEGKGNILAQTTYPLLKELERIDFVGNIEGRDVFSNKARVIVCEGFVGNVVLKLAESIYSNFCSSVSPDNTFLPQFNYENYGGTPILGIDKVVLIGHGVSSAQAFFQMLNNAHNLVQNNVMSKIDL